MLVCPRGTAREESSSAETGDTEVPLKKARQDEDPQTANVVTENGHAQN